MMLTDIHGVIAGPGADQGDERRAFEEWTRTRRNWNDERLADSWNGWQARALSVAQPVAQEAIPAGYALISIDTLRAWGKLDEVRDACKYPLAAPQPSQGAPIDMVLHCPACGMQHIDAPEELPMPMPGSAFEGSAGWTNPPHRSHLCHGCGHIWRPADVPTNGVAAVKTKGEADSQPASADAGKGVSDAD